MTDPSKEVIGMQVAKAVAQRAAALEVLRESPRRPDLSHYIGPMIGAAIPGSYLGNVAGVNGGWLMGAVVVAALTLGVQVTVETHRMRKRLEAAITILLQESERAA